MRDDRELNWGVQSRNGEKWTELRETEDEGQENHASWFEVEKNRESVRVTPRLCTLAAGWGWRLHP